MAQLGLFSIAETSAQIILYDCMHLFWRLRVMRMCVRPLTMWLTGASAVFASGHEGGNPCLLYLLHYASPEGLCISSSTAGDILSRLQWFTRAGFADVRIKRIGPKWYRGVRRHGLIMGCSVTGIKPKVHSPPCAVGNTTQTV